MAEHKHGEMDIKDQEAMFAGFMNFTTKFVIFVVVLFIAMALFIT